MDSRQRAAEPGHYRYGSFRDLRSGHPRYGCLFRRDNETYLQNAGSLAHHPLQIMSSEKELKQWYVIRAIGGKEKKVKEYIESEVRQSHLEEYISQVLIPTEKVYTIRNGKKVSKEKVSYPGYVLVEAAMVGEIPYILRNTPNVLGFLGDSKEDSKRMIATPIRPAEVARILGRVDELSEGEEENEVPFFVGETVKVTDGPFSSFSGTIDAVDNDRKKLTVSVKIFGRKTPLELSFMQVEKE